MIKCKIFITVGLVSILSFSIFSCSHSESKIISYNRNGTKGIVFEYTNSSDTLSYYVRIYYPDGKLQKEAQVVDGKYVGLKYTYFHNGRIYQIDSLTLPYNRHSQKWNGILIRNYPNGKISQRFVVKDGIFDGLFQQYGEQGQLIKQYILTNDSIKNGLYEEYYDNGRLLYSSTYVNDLEDGKAIYFNENGDTTKYLNYKSGQLVLPFKKWLTNGQVLVGDYVDESRSNIQWKWYDRSGKLIKKKIIVRGREGDFSIPE